jgi:N-methylhydantoinase B
MSANKIDSFTLDIIQNSLITAAEEIFAVFGHTSKSPVIYEVLDYACGLTDDKGKMIAQANGVPGFLGTLDMAVVQAIKKFGLKGFSEGDIVVTNIPYTDGTHLNDVTLIMPIYYRGEIVAFSANKGHWSEVGGMHFGSWTSDSTEIYQEGLQFPTIKLFAKEKPVQEVVDIIRANVRTPAMTLGDMEAQAASLRVGGRRVRELCGKYGAKVVRNAMDRLIEQGEQLMLKRLRELPHGTFTAEDWVDDDGITDNPVHVKAAVEIDDRTFTIDLTGSGPQAKGSINSPWVATVSAARTILKAVTDPHVPVTDGSFHPLRIIAPEGTIFNPKPPAPTSTYWEAMAFVTDLVWKALAPSVPERLTAGHFLSVCATILGGVDDRTKEPFAIVEPQAGGWGAGKGKDGESGLVCSGDGETYIMSNEVIEVRHPIIVEQYRLNVEDHVSHGEYRGGFGLVKDYRINNSNATFTASFGRSKYPPWGMDGGEPGGPNYFIIYRTGKEPLRTRKVAAVELTKGDLIRLKTGCGGAYGRPFNRDPKRVARDVRDEYITVEVAKGNYGVALKPDLEPDYEKTETVRLTR